MSVEYYTKLILGLLWSSAMLAMGSDLPKGKLYVKNSLWSVAGAPRLEVSFKSNDKLVKKVINPDQIRPLGTLVGIEEDAPVKIAGYGKIKARTVNPADISKSAFIKELTQLDPTLKEDLLVDVSWKTYYGNDVMFTYSLVTEPIKRMDSLSEMNPLAIFPDVVSYGLQNFVTVDELERVKSWRQVVVPESKHWGLTTTRATTAEDMYRYILGLGDNYTKDDVMSSYKELALKWHPDKFTDEDDKKVATVVTRLIIQSKDGLLQALKDK